MNSYISIAFNNDANIQMDANYTNIFLFLLRIQNVILSWVRPCFQSPRVFLSRIVPVS